MHSGDAIACNELYKIYYSNSLLLSHIAISWMCLQSELDLMFRLFDVNRNRVLEVCL